MGWKSYKHPVLGGDFISKIFSWSLSVIFNHISLLAQCIQYYMKKEICSIKKRHIIGHITAINPDHRKKMGNEY